MSYRSIKIYDEDYDRAQEIRLDRGIDLMEALGCALEGWKKLTRKEQDQIVRSRAKRQHAETAVA